MLDIVESTDTGSTPAEDADLSLSKRQMAVSTSEDGGFDTAVNGNGSGNSDILIPLPHSESIPQQFWTLACGWIPIVGRDIVACLFSRDWQASTYYYITTYSLRIMLCKYLLGLYL